MRAWGASIVDGILRPVRAFALPKGEQAGENLFRSIDEQL
jgi:hypothetical protein